ncbi:TldD/PmbA family protein [Aquibaculum sediminis]|uniref:TldD/PmbA family protein n=1 Tax=Aquibaculum sediminis TaxID=3231907 RepID=UPI0034543C81
MTQDPERIAAADTALVEQLVERAKAAGAEAADAILLRSTAISHAQRLGEVERLEREESLDLGLRVLIGRRQAMVSTTDHDADSLSALIERAVAMAKVVPEDRWCGLAEPEQLAHDHPDVESNDPVEPSPEALIERARACEEAARAVPGITNSEGAEASWGSTRVSLAATNGFRGTYVGSRHSVGVSVLAGEGLEMQRDYDFSSTVFGTDLDDPSAVGRRAGERTVARLNPRKPRTAKLPVVLDPRMASGMLRSLIGAISGPAVARGTSFLKDKLGEAIFAPGIRIIDEPHRRRGLRSRPFDGEGLPTREQAIIDDGRLTTWLLDLASARQLGMAPTGHGSRGVSGPPGPSCSNVWLAPGSRSPQELIGEIEEGFYITEMIGMGVNPVTGDYSRGAGGFWIENGEITTPVSEATVAGNLLTMYAGLTPANDLDLRFGIDSPTVRIDGLTVAGA